MILVISCSLNPFSRSRGMAEFARDQLHAQSVAVNFIDIHQYDLPLCDGNTAYSHPGALQLKEAGHAADAILLAMPVYNFSVSAAAKNVVELAGRSWANKPVGMLMAAGGRGGYMSSMSLANSLMLDFRCLIIPRFVYAGPNDFEDQLLVSRDIQGRIRELTHELVRVSQALQSAPALPRSDFFDAD